MSQKEKQNFNNDTRDNINTKDFLIGTLIGGIVGAATALFLAPKSGKELRNDLNVQASNWVEKTEKLRQSAYEKGTELAGTAKDKTSTLKEAVSNKSLVLVNKVKNLKENGPAADQNNPSFTSENKNSDNDTTVSN